MKDYSKIPAHMRGGLERYVEHHIKPGSFLMAVLENNFVLALGRVDDINREHLMQWGDVLYNELPQACWGSPEKVQSWLDNKEREED